MTASCTGASTVGHCAVSSLPDTRGCGEPPQLGGKVSCMWYASHESYKHHSTHTHSKWKETHTVLARQQQQCHVCCTSVTLTVRIIVKLSKIRKSTMHPQVMPDGGHDVREPCAGASTVVRCAVSSLPDARECGEPPQLGGKVSCMWHASHESYTHHSTHSGSLKVERNTLSASARQQQQCHVCCTSVTLT